MKKVYQLFMAGVFALTGINPVQAQGHPDLPFWNDRLPLEQRVNDVVSRLTLEEKVGQMLNATPAIPRLGIPAYDWWNEVLHGVARTPFHVTSYPQAIGMAATWDTTSLKTMADYSAMEGRAIHNKAIALHKTGDRYLGLTYWTPNINIFRDPRWGRGQETYGEDPFLTAQLGAAFVRGLQGNDPHYLKAAACAKHFAVHSGPEPTRHSDNFNPNPYDLWDTYLPAFRELVVNAKVAGVMCAYNAINTQPCCANDLLMNDILRKQWNFTGYVTSDCWALDDFFRYHKTHKDSTASAIDALIHGTDVECGRAVYLALIDAVRSGRIAESQLDVSLKRLFTIRFRLGMFDPPTKVRYAQASEKELEAPAHQAHALKMARQSVVLLRNQGQLLPLSKKIKKILVVGPNADNRIAILGNYNGSPSRVVTVLEGLRKKLGATANIQYEKAINFTDDTLLVYDDASLHYQLDGKPGFKAEYFSNANLEGSPAFTRMEETLDHYWLEGQNPVPGLSAENYSARFTTRLTATMDRTLHFEVEGDDGYRVLVNDKLIVDAWQRNRWGARQFNVPVENGKTYTLKIEFQQSSGPALIRLHAGVYRPTDMSVLAAKAATADAVIFVGGISPQLEGEEMPVAIPGFKGGDRTSILLPAVQTRLLQALSTSGKPVVFVMMTGSALAVPWEAEHVPAIVNAWYGGQSAGEAVADVLFGDYNPAGRLPVTFYKSDSDLPDFSSYSMENRTYRYFTGTPLYSFGYGLSYTTFHYDQLTLPAAGDAGKNIVARVRVTNTGNRDGEEVVQLYMQSLNKERKVPLKALKGFQRVFLRKGESRVISFTLTPDQRMIPDATGKLLPIKGTLRISVGGHAPGEPNAATSDLVTKDLLIR